MLVGKSLFHSHVSIFYVLSLLSLNLSWEIVHLKVPPSSSGADFRLEEYA